ncbi:MAG: ribulose-phosphate 3-epimerase [Candidatus Thermoplasmatota archaeon]
MVKVAPSILSADFSKLGEEIKAIEKAEADWVHIDVMDGHFVPNITIGPAVISKIRNTTDLFFDVHLMIEDPNRYIENFVDAGADLITFHVEAVENPSSIIKKIKEFGCKAGVSLNPDTPAEEIEDLLPLVDLVLVMTVHPGFGGQSFITDVLSKIKKVRELIDTSDREIILEVDGGVNDKNSVKLREYGVDVLVAGSFIFKSKDYSKAINSLKE